MTLCPECGNLLQPVALKTVKRLLKYPLARVVPDGRFHYCSDSECDVYYVLFAETDGTAPAEVFRADSIKESAAPFAKDGERLVCYCFGHTVAEIQDDARSARRIPGAIAAEVRAGTCACEVMNPSGH